MQVSSGQPPFRSTTLIRVNLTDECRALLREFGIDETVAVHAVQHSHGKLSDRGLKSYCAIRWLNGFRGLFVFGTITVQTLDEQTNRVHIDEVKIPLVLQFARVLPAGRFGRETDIAIVLDLLAESFGVPIRCHPDEPFSTLYSGPAIYNSEKSAPFIQFRDKPVDDILLLGTCQPGNGYAEHFWAFSLTKYREWLSSHEKFG